ncbi:hypothetical protein V6N11_065452 [Hibiscus sabdariffa]|uniref:Uncharacterized protein n=1 Tax=Hibiscus sabdariffa TaxID=183260 RepID=A0ABR2PHD7_9ROSI
MYLLTIYIQVPPRNHQTSPRFSTSFPHSPQALNTRTGHATTHAASPRVSYLRLLLLSRVLQPPQPLLLRSVRFLTRSLSSGPAFKLSTAQTKAKMR